MAKNTYLDSPFGIAVFPHLNKADAKFNADRPLFKVDLELTGEAAQTFKQRVDTAAQAAYDDFFETGDGKNLTPAERKKMAVYYPYEVMEDAEGNPTGAIRFHFRQNATINLRDGTSKQVVIGLYDAGGKEMHKLVRGGSEIRINYSMRPIPMKSLKQVGVRLDFSRVQVRKLSEGNSGGFGAVEGYEDDGEQGAQENGPAPSGSADY